MQSRYRMEFRVDPSSKPPILQTQVACAKGKSHLLQNVWMELEYSSAHMEHLQVEQ
jgi:hypothetical protein